MNISGDLLIEAPRETVFDRLQDPRQFVSLVEGVRDLQEIDPTHYTAILETRVAYIKFKVQVAVEVTQPVRRSSTTAESSCPILHVPPGW